MAVRTKFPEMNLTEKLLNISISLMQEDFTEEVIAEELF